LIPADIDYKISELVFEVDGKIITINKDAVEVIDKLIMVSMSFIMNKIKIKDGTLD
jgi:hypothetical protein